MDKKGVIYNYLKDNDKGKKMNLDNVKEIFSKIKKIYDWVNEINKNDLDALIETLGLDDKIKGYEEINKRIEVYNYLKDNELSDKLNWYKVKETFDKVKETHSKANNIHDWLNGLNKNDLDAMIDTLDLNNKIKGDDEIKKKTKIYNYLKDDDKAKNINLDDVKERFNKIKNIYDVVGKFDLEKLKITKQLLGFNQSWKKTFNIDYEP